MNIIDSEFKKLLAAEKPIILDGGLATELEAQGHDLSSNLWSAELLMDRPQAIADAHRAYFDAGANCTISASYQATKAGFMTLGLNADQAKALILKSVTLAATARDAFVLANPTLTARPLVAASIGPYGASLADGSEYTGKYNISDIDLTSFHRERLNWLDNSGADILACETIPSLQEAKILHMLLRNTVTPAWISFSCKDGKHLNDGTLIKTCAKLFLNHPTVLAIGINCTSPIYINGLIKEIKSATPQQHVVVYPNSGEEYDASNNRWNGTVTPLECGKAAKDWHQNGAKIIGGCCRMGPSHIKEIKRNLV